MADKIEQSTSVQSLFNELLRFFETEAQCVGPAFGSPTINNNENLESKINLANTDTDVTQVDSQLPTIFGFRISCSGRLQMSSFSKPAEKAESLEITRGILPLNTVKANIDFAQTYSTNAYGTCGIKI